VSEGKNPLAAALLATQKAMPALHKDSKAEVVSKKTGAKFSYTYLSLTALLEQAIPVLNEHGLSLLQMPSLREDGAQVLITTLLHGDSGEQFIGETPLILAGEQTPQTWGGAVTYARRYALTALLGIAADEDDDGASASRPWTAVSPKRQSEFAAQNSAEEKTRPASAAASRRIHAIITELAEARGAPREQVQSALKGALEIESMANLSATDAARADGILAEWKQKVGVGT
jgi:hypothetical protein